MRVKSFTLIQLIVILTIIAIIAISFIAIWKKEKNNALKAQCRFNQKLSGLAITQYIDDNNYKFLTYVQKGQFGYKQKQNYYQILMENEYISPVVFYDPLSYEESILLCPSLTDYNQDYNSLFWSYGVIVPINNKYDQMFGNFFRNQHSYNIIDLSKIHNPTKYSYLYDSINNNAKDLISYNLPGSQISNSLAKIYTRHQGQTNSLFVDGHVESRTKNKYIHDIKIFDPDDNYYSKIIISKLTE